MCRNRHFQFTIRQTQKLPIFARAQCITINCQTEIIHMTQIQKKHRLVYQLVSNFVTVNINIVIDANGYCLSITLVGNEYWFDCYQLTQQYGTSKTLLTFQNIQQHCNFCPKIWRSEETAGWKNNVKYFIYHANETKIHRQNCWIFCEHHNFINPPTGISIIPFVPQCTYKPNKKYCKTHICQCILPQYDGVTL